MQTAEQLIATQRAHAETAFALANMAFDGAEKVVKLNLQTAKSALDEAAARAQAVLSVQDAQALLAIQSELLQPLAEKTAAYGRQVYEIASATNADVSKVLEAQLADLQQRFLAAVDTAFQNAPAGSENAVALVKANLAAASSAYESLHKVATQAVEAARGDSGTANAKAADDAQEQPA
ncbi:phasin family protein [uncultured Azohydromonas sp.]|jgi:phasin family protein|uniref:phasin family protein n=1 Tax=uncultured Azohydromonas sp. TaxID=487342 RepID=UPI0026275A95|nr:phasin family protein [uncultured Azohydromonas sp.]